jgi:hypothetical protein
VGGTEVGAGWIVQQRSVQLNMCSWEVDAGNNQAHAERAGRALWAALR